MKKRIDFILAALIFTIFAPILLVFLLIYCILGIINPNWIKEEASNIKEQYNKLLEQNKQLQADNQLKDKMIEKLIKDAMCYDEYSCEADRKGFYNDYKQQAIKELEVSNEKNN
jgi:cell division protein FtsB